MSNKIFDTCKLPTNFLKSKYIPAPKINEANECSDYSTGSLFSQAAKVLLIIIKNGNTPVNEKKLPGKPSTILGTFQKDLLK